jgi:Ca2+-binding RTX toxin-like protein
LVVGGNGVLGGFAVDLSSTTDQLTQYGGVANAAVQKGFESVNLGALTGSFGSDVTGSDGANTITVNDQNSNVDAGKGNDTISGGEGTDVLIGGAGNDTFVIRTLKDYFSTATGTSVGEDTITGGTGTDTIALEAITISVGDDWQPSKISGISSITVNTASATAFSITTDDDFYSDTGITTIDLSADTNTTGTNVINISNDDAVAQAFTLTGGAGVEQITGDGGVDTITPGGGADIIKGNGGLDVIALATDGAIDTVHLIGTSDGGAAGADSTGDVITGFESTSDKITLSGALATALDDITNNTALAFLTTGINDGNTSAAVAASLTATNEMLLLNKANSGVAAADLGDISVVQTALEAQITLTAANTDDGLIVIESSDVTGRFGVYYYLENGTNADQFDVGELTVLATGTADAIAAGDFITT